MSPFGKLAPLVRKRGRGGVCAPRGRPEQIRGDRRRAPEKSVVDRAPWYHCFDRSSGRRLFDPGKSRRFADYREGNAAPAAVFERPRACSPAPGSPVRSPTSQGARACRSVARREPTAERRSGHSEPGIPTQTFRFRHADSGDPIQKFRHRSHPRPRGRVFFFLPTRCSLPCRRASTGWRCARPRSLEGRAISKRAPVRQALAKNGVSIRSPTCSRSWPARPSASRPALRYDRGRFRSPRARQPPSLTAPEPDHPSRPARGREVERPMTPRPR